MNTLAAGVRPANPVRTPPMSKSVCLAIETARLHLRYGNPGGYARCLSAEHRAQTGRQQRAIEAVIAADATAHLFTRHATNGCLLSREG